VFTGHSAVSFALALPKDGKLVACDISQEYMDIAKKYFEEAGVDNIIEPRVGNAVDTLDKMITDGEKDYDFAFIDADKVSFYI